MPNGVLLISEKGAPLTCAEADANYLALLQRSNHVGTQSASTIYDLATSVMTIPGIQGLSSSIAQLQGQMSDLQEQVLGQEGYVATLINNLRNELTEDISDLRALVNQHTAQIAALQAADSTINTRITNVENTFNDALDGIDITIDCIKDGTCMLVPRPPDGQGDLVLAYDDETNALIWGLPLLLFCGPLVEGAFPVGRDAYINLGSLT